MALQLFASRKLRDCQKAERWLKERRIPFSFVDMDIKDPSAGELDSISKAVGGFEALIDTESNFYKKEGYAWREFDIREELLSKPKLIKLPILRNAPKALVGFDEQQWKDFISGISE